MSTPDLGADDRREASIPEQPAERSAEPSAEPIAEPAEVDAMRRGGDAAGAARNAEAEEVVIPLVAETARVGVRAVERGRVRVTTRTDTAEEVVRRTLRGDAVEVTHVPVGRTLAEGEAVPQARTEGDLTIVPVLEEVLVVETRLVLREEIHLRRITSGQDVEVPVTLRRQRAVIERLGPGSSPARGPGEDARPDSQPTKPEETGS